MSQLFSVVIILLIALFFIPLNSVLAENTNGVKIEDIQVRPAVVEIGKTFSISATLFNNSTIPIHVQTDDCAGSFSVVFDHNVKVNKDSNFCFLMLTYHLLDPEQKFTATDPPLGTTYTATASGIVNATVKFSYIIPNQSNSTTPNNIKTVSKSILFTISDNSTNGVKNHEIHPVTNQIISPLKQFNSGIVAKDVVCQASLQLIIKNVVGSPSCVTPRTASILIERGWGHLP